MIDQVAIIGAGNGGKASAADLVLQGRRVRLFEFPEYRQNVAEILETRTLTATGDVEGEAVLERATTDLGEAMEGADTVMVCTQSLAHDRIARELAPYIRPEHIVILNPGSTGGTLHFAQVFRELGIKRMPVLVEFGTLTYGCRAVGPLVEIPVKVDRVLYGTMPAAAIKEVGPPLEALYPGLRRGASVLEAGLKNANPVIHPPITILNAALIENEGDKKFFYGDGVSPKVAELIRKLDEERMALLRALGYAAQPDPVTSVEQGYAADTDYCECYKKGPGFGKFRFPNTLDNRYFHEDIGMSLVMFCSLGKVLGVPTPVSEGVVRIGEILAGVDYSVRGMRTVESLGLGGLGIEEFRAYLETGRLPEK